MAILELVKEFALVEIAKRAVSDAMDTGRRAREIKATGEPGWTLYVGDVVAGDFTPKPVASPIGPVDATATVSVQERTDLSYTDYLQQISMKQANGDPIADFGLTPNLNGNAIITGDHNVYVEQAIITLNNITKELNGPSLVQKLSKAAAASVPPDNVTQAITDTPNYYADDIAKAAQDGVLPKPDELKKQIQKQFGKHDGSRVSKEHHEYLYCIHKSKYWPDYVDLFAVTEFTLTYVGPGANARPTFGEWVDLPNLRTLFKIVRRFNRQASACGGKALWVEQGFASKNIAVLNYIADSEGGAPNSYSIARDALIAESSSFTA